jgi:hypothetical protein
MTRHWTFGQKVGAGFAVTVALAVTIGVVAVIALRSVVASKDRVIDVDAQLLIDAQALQTKGCRHPRVPADTRRTVHYRDAGSASGDCASA